MGLDYLSELDQILGGGGEPRLEDGHRELVLLAVEAGLGDLDEVFLGTLLHDRTVIIMEFERSVGIANTTYHFPGAGCSFSCLISEGALTSCRKGLNISGLSIIPNPTNVRARLRLFNSVELVLR